METLSVCPWRREKHYSKVARALGLRVLSLNCCFLRGMEVIPIMLNIKDMLCGASHNCSKSKLYFQHHFSQKSTLFPLSLYLPVKKRKRKRKVPVCDEQRSGSPWECSQRTDILCRQWHGVIGHVLPSTLGPRVECVQPGIAIREWQTYGNIVGQCQANWEVVMGGYLQ